MAWRVEFLDETVSKEFRKLPPDLRKDFDFIVNLIEAVGIERVRMPHLKHLEDILWEMRLQGRNGIARALYVTATGQRVVVVRVFVKKTEKTPPKEIALALKRAREVR